MALRVPKPRRAAAKRRVKSEDISGRGTGEKPYAWLRVDETTQTREEARARRGHRKLPPLPRTAAPQEFHRRRLRGGRPAGKHAPLERRLRRAFVEDRAEVRLSREDVRALVELYGRIGGRWRENTSVMFARAATRGVIDRVEALEGEMKRSGVEAKIARELREIVEQARETLMLAVEVDVDVEGEEERKKGRN